MARAYYYITGTDCAVRKSGSVRQVELFDGPHSTPEAAHEVARQMIVAGNYEVVE